MLTLSRAGYDCSQRPAFSRLVFQLSIRVGLATVSAFDQLILVLSRGRTTTGMVAAALTFNILLLQGEASDPLTSPVTLLSQSIANLDKEEDLFAKGKSPRCADLSV